MTDISEPHYSGQAQVSFCRHLGDSWRYLAMYLEIPESDSDGFDKGDEGRAILNWLRQRNRLAELPAALDYIGRPELALLLPPAPAPLETQRWPKERGSPYPGLTPFTAGYAPVFFGRDRHIALLLERLQTTRFLAVIGASGSGKSSLVAAGLLPHLKDNALPGSQDWIVLEFKPGGLHNDPFEALAYQLELLLKPAGLSAREIYRKLHARHGLSELYGRVRAQRSQAAEFLLFIDQFEELFTLCSGEHRPLFISLLDEAAGTTGLRIVLTLRSDFVSHCLEHGRLAERLNTGFYSLPTPTVVDLYEMITRPAALAGLRFEDQKLPLEILDDTGNEPGMLALMAAALAELYEKRTPDGTLTRTAYEALGKVEGVIAKLADEAYEGLSAEAKDALGSVFGELVEIDERGIATRRRTTLDQIRRTPATNELVDRFTGPKVRLLVTSEGENHQPLVEVAHEALLRSWRQLAYWITETRDDLVILDQLRSAATYWYQQGRNDAFLWPIERFQLARDMLNRLQPSLHAREQEFLNSSDKLISKLLEEIDDPDTSHKRRANIGDLLGKYRDPRPGVNLTDSLPAIEWCDVMGSEIILGNKKRLFLVKQFRISKYLTTYEQYWSFMKAKDGYRQTEWWSGIPFSAEEPSTQYRKISNHPVENVSWYDAIAFCRWLSSKLGYEVRLPTEWEWQQAATGSNDKKVYPWGEEWDIKCTNTRESGIFHTTAVGMYPQGVSLVGALDMSGNVWEWCLNEYWEPDCIDIEGEKPRAIRGGSWINNREAAQTTYRQDAHPKSRSNSLGFRLARP